MTKEQSRTIAKYLQLDIEDQARAAGFIDGLITGRKYARQEPGEIIPFNKTRQAGDLEKIKK